MTVEKYKIATSYQRSTRLDVDLSHLMFEKLILHESYKELIDKIVGQYESGQHAFTLTGPYGGGKSTFAVLLSGLLSSDEKIKKTAEKLLSKKTLNRFRKSFNSQKNGWVVIKVVSDSDDYITSLHSAMKNAIDDFWGKRVPKEISNLSKPRNYNSLIKQFELVSSYAAKKGGGLIIIYDELGKVFENAANNNTDVYFFQVLSENFNRSKDPCIFLGILHQAFQEYAKNTSQTIRDDWAKIQGRFIDLPFSIGIEEVIKLINNAILGPTAPKVAEDNCKKVVASLNDNRLKNLKNFDKELLRCWPLNPMTALLLGPISKRRFGQNERSTFGFLTSQEPFGFKYFLTNKLKKENSYNPDMLWDYLKHNLEPAIIVSPDGHKWSEATTTIKRVEDKDVDKHVTILKAISIIDLFGKPYGLVANEKTLKLIFQDISVNELSHILKDLRNWSSIIFKKHLDSYAIFSGSDIDLDSEIKNIENNLDTNTDKYLELIELEECVIAKRHYHEKGTLRWLDKRLCSIKDLDNQIENWETLKGEIGSFVLCSEKIDNPKKYKDSPIVVGYSENINELKSCARDLRILNIAKENISSLAGDRVAREELFSRIDETTNNLKLITKDSFNQAKWFFDGKPVDNKNLSYIASKVADEFYAKSPKINSEIINKDKPSSSAAAAQRKLLYAMVANPLNIIEETKYNNEKENLGIEKHPPELGLYLTLLNAEKIHKKDKELGIWKFSRPTRGNFLKMWKEAEIFLESCSHTSKPLSDLYERWEKKPFGLKKGVLPIYAMAFMLVNEDKAGFYLDGMYKANLNAIFVERLSHSPKNITIRYFDSKGIHKNTLKHYSDLATKLTKTSVKKDVLKVAKPIAKIVVNLPEYTKLTKTLTTRTKNIRDVILRANDPIKLIAVDLKTACGLKKAEKINKEMMKNLEDSMNELKSCYDNLIEKLKSEFFNELNLKGKEKKQTEDLQKRAQKIKESNSKPGLKFDGLIDTLSDAAYENNWIDLCASKLVNKRPKVWSDSDEKNFYIELHEFAKQFMRVEDYAKAKMLKSTLNLKEKETIKILKDKIGSLLEGKDQKLQEIALLDLLRKK